MMNEVTDVARSDKVRTAGAIVLALLGLYLISLTVSEVQGWRFIGAGLPATNTITVSGKGEVFAVPDIGTFTFSVSEKASSVAKAQEIATSKINKAIDYLKAQGVPEKDIKTVGYNAYPQYEWQQEACTPLRCPPGRSVLTGYQVTQSVQVKVRDTARVGDLLTGVGATGISDLSGIEFTVDDDESIKAEAREQAIADAKSKAELLAKTLGVRLVRITGFWEDSGNIAYGRGGYGFDAAMSETKAPAPQIPTGENQFVSNVTITYEIR